MFLRTAAHTVYPQGRKETPYICSTNLVLQQVRCSNKLSSLKAVSCVTGRDMILTCPEIIKAVVPGCAVSSPAVHFRTSPASSSQSVPASGTRPILADGSAGTYMCRLQLSKTPTQIGSTQDGGTHKESRSLKRCDTNVHSSGRLKPIT